MPAATVSTGLVIPIRATRLRAPRCPRRHAYLATVGQSPGWSGHITPGSITLKAVIARSTSASSAVRVRRHAARECASRFGQHQVVLPALRSNAKAERTLSVPTPTTTRCSLSSQEQVRPFLDGPRLCERPRPSGLPFACPPSSAHTSRSLAGCDLTRSSRTRGLRVRGDLGRRRSPIRRTRLGQQFRTRQRCEVAQHLLTAPSPFTGSQSVNDGPFQTNDARHRLTCFLVSPGASLSPATSDPRQCCRRASASSVSCAVCSDTRFKVWRRQRRFSRSVRFSGQLPARVG